jgi:hypothetical protein
MVHGNERKLSTLGNEKSITYRPSTSVYSSNPTLTVSSHPTDPWYPAPRVSRLQIEALQNDTWRLAAGVRAC